MATIHFYLVRHGQTRLNRSRRLQGTTNSPLTKKGKRMAKRLGKELQNIRFTAVYTSDLKRTHETAELILSENKRGCPPVYRDPDLRELSFGKFEEANNMAVIPTALRTLGLRKILRAFANDEHVAELTELFRTMDGEEEIETSVHLEKRFRRALETIAQEYPDQDANILIVTHGLILSNFIESLKGEVPLFLLDNSRASLIDYKNGNFEIKYVNQIKQESEKID